MKYFKPVGILVFVATIGIGAWYGWKHYTTPFYDTTKVVSYSFTIKNTTNRVLNEAEFWTYAPVLETSSQHCCNQLEVSQAYQIEKDGLGNQVLHFRLQPLAPYATRVIRIKTGMQLATVPNKKYSFKAIGFINKEPLLEIDHAEIKTAAASLAAEATLQTTRKIYDWVAENIRDTGYLREARGALNALQNKRGDCTESAYLFVALARANGIPARAVGGYFLENNGLLRANQYHEWAEFYDNGTWSIADPQKKVFDEYYSHYVAMHIVDNSEDSAYKFARYRHAGNGLEVKMN